MTLRPLRALRQINASIYELERADMRAREEARLEIARSTTAYSQRAREVVDGTMSLSAVLMRAGEVSQAERLLAEAERDVESEKENLLETVQEVRVASLDRKDKMTRLRLAKMVATAFLGGSVFAFSAIGVAVAKYFTDVAPASPAGSSVAADETARYEVSPMRRIILPLGDMKLQLSPEEYEEFRRLMSEDDAEKIRSFLLGIVPSRLAGKLDRALQKAGIVMPAQLAELASTGEKLAQQVRRPGGSSSASSSSSGGSGSQEGSQPRSDGEKKGDSGSGDDGSSGDPTGCEDEGQGDGGHHIHVGPLDQCVPFLEKDEDGG